MCCIFPSLDPAFQISVRIFCRHRTRLLLELLGTVVNWSMEMAYLFIGFIGLLISFSVNGMTLVHGYLWKDISVNVYGIFMTFVAVGIIRTMRASHGREERPRSSGDRRRRSRGGGRMGRGRESGMERILLQNKAREIKMYAAWFAVCLVTAFSSTFLLQADLRTSMRAASSFMLYGSIDPYMAPEKMKKVEGEMKEAIKAILK